MSDAVQLSPVSAEMPARDLVPITPTTTVGAQAGLPATGCFRAMLLADDALVSFVAASGITRTSVALVKGWNPIAFVKVLAEGTDAIDMWGAV